MVFTSSAFSIRLGCQVRATVDCQRIKQLERTLKDGGAGVLRRQPQHGSTHLTIPASRSPLNFGHLPTPPGVVLVVDHYNVSDAHGVGILLYMMSAVRVS